jgi:hypothetical protein
VKIPWFAVSILSLKDPEGAARFADIDNFPDDGNAMGNVLASEGSNFNTSA